MTLAEIYSKQNNFKKQEKPPAKKQLNVVVHMPEVAGLIKHLDLLYTKMLMSGNQQQESQQVSWYNHGDSRVREA
tara:strand:+ start:350 stop:574 length:225 start_codon:yes stop_codon:yes gene_type:complete